MEGRRICDRAADALRLLGEDELVDAVGAALRGDFVALKALGDDYRAEIVEALGNARRGTLGHRCGERARRDQRGGSPAEAPRSPAGGSVDGSRWAKRFRARSGSWRRGRRCPARRRLPPMSRWIPCRAPRGNRGRTRGPCPGGRAGGAIEAGWRTQPASSSRCHQAPGSRYGTDFATASSTSCGVRRTVTDTVSAPAAAMFSDSAVAVASSGRVG